MDRIAPAATIRNEFPAFSRGEPAPARRTPPPEVLATATTPGPSVLVHWKLILEATARRWPASVLAVYLAIEEEARAGGHPYTEVSGREIGAIIDQPPQTVFRNLDRLEEIGLIHRERRQAGGGESITIWVMSKVGPSWSRLDVLGAEGFVNRPAAPADGPAAPAEDDGGWRGPGRGKSHKGAGRATSGAPARQIRRACAPHPARLNTKAIQIQNPLESEGLSPGGMGADPGPATSADAGPPEAPPALAAPPPAGPDPAAVAQALATLEAPVVPGPGGQELAFMRRARTLAFHDLARMGAIPPDRAAEWSERFGPAPDEPAPPPPRREPPAAKPADASCSAVPGAAPQVPGVEARIAALPRVPEPDRKAAVKALAGVVADRLETDDYYPFIHARLMDVARGRIPTAKVTLAYNRAVHSTAELKSTVFFRLMTGGCKVPGKWADFPGVGQGRQAAPPPHPAPALAAPRVLALAGPRPLALPPPPAAPG